MSIAIYDMTARIVDDNHDKAFWWEEVSFISRYGPDFPFVRDWDWDDLFGKLLSTSKIAAGLPNWALKTLKCSYQPSSSAAAVGQSHLTHPPTNQESEVFDYS